MSKVGRLFAKMQFEESVDGLKLVEQDIVLFQERHYMWIIPHEGKFRLIGCTPLSEDGRTFRELKGECFRTDSNIIIESMSYVPVRKMRTFLTTIPPRVYNRLPNEYQLKMIKSSQGEYELLYVEFSRDIHVLNLVTGHTHTLSGKRGKFPIRLYKEAWCDKNQFEFFKKELF